MIDLAQNLNALGSPSHARELLLENVDAFFQYPNNKSEEARIAVSEWLQIDKESVAVGNGTTEIIYSLPDVLERKRNIIISPTFWQYNDAFRRSGKWNVQKFMLEYADFSLDYDSLQATLDEEPSDTSVYLCNPNNPTSTLLSKKLLKKIITTNPDVFFIIDETYVLFREDCEEQSLLQDAANEKNLIVLISLSKIYRLPGIRVGVMISCPDIVTKFLDKKMPYMANPIAAKVLPSLLSDKAFIDRTRSFYDEQKKKLFDLLSGEFRDEIEIHEPEAIFILVRLLTQKTSDQICSLLLKKGIAIRSGKELPDLGEKWIRISVGQDHEHQKLMEALRSCFDSYTQHPH